MKVLSIGGDYPAEQRIFATDLSPCIISKWNEMKSRISLQKYVITAPLYILHDKVSMFFCIRPIACGI